MNETALALGTDGLCVCVCSHPIYSGRQTCGCTSRSFASSNVKSNFWLLLLFLTISVLVANPRNTTWYFTRWPILSWSAEQEISDASKCLGATQVDVTQVSVRLASLHGFLRLVGWANGCRFAKFYASVCINNFPSLVASLFSWRYLATSSSSFLHATINPRLPSMTASSHTSAFNAIAFHSPVMPNARMSLCTQSVHLFSFPSRPLRTAPSRFPNMIRFGSRPPLMRMSVPAHKSLFVRNAVSMFSYRVISRARLYEVIRWSGLLRCAPMMRRKTR